MAVYQFALRLGKRIEHATSIDPITIKSRSEKYRLCV